MMRIEASVLLSPMQRSIAPSWIGERFFGDAMIALEMR